jgi:magnesium-transporting ATPase (P-type)
MTDKRFSPQPLARWYVAGAIAAFIFMLLISGMFVLQVTTDPVSLPLDQRFASEAQPIWVTAALAVAAWVGLLGSFMLVLRRKIALPLMLVSLVGVLAWLAGLLAVPGLREAISANDLAVAIVIAAIVWTIFWFARHSNQRGWLR